MRSYGDLVVWSRAVDLVEACYRATDPFPTTERYGLVSQICRAAVSVASNIAEGHARSSGDYLRHLTIAAGSLVEIETQFLISLRLGFVRKSDLVAASRLAGEVGRMLTALRRKLKTLKP